MKPLYPNQSPFATRTKRLYDLLFAGCGLVVLSPLFLLMTVLIKLADGGPVFFRQVRIGRQGRPFRIWKFRTMVPGANRSGPAVTRAGDARITWLGRFLRDTKLDELPQLWNVLRGDMSLVGPRPEVPKYVRQYTPQQRQILRYKPGITDLASLCFRHEESLLREAGNLESFYVRQCLPRKLWLNLAYAERANLFSDTWLILQTLCPYWLGMLAVYGGVLSLSFWLSCLLLYDFALPPHLGQVFWRQGLVVVALQLGCLTWRHQCRGLLSFFSLPELAQTGTALGCAALLMLGLWWSGATGWPPSNVILLDALLALGLLSGFRLLLRRWRERSAGGAQAPAGPPVRVGIIGAGRAGAWLALELGFKREWGRRVVAFFDDDFQKWQKFIHDVPVVGMPECLLDGWDNKLDEVVIALPKAAAQRQQEIVEWLSKTRLRIYTVSPPVESWSPDKAHSETALH